MSHDTKTKLVYMANQIATFFKSQPQNEAAQGVAMHINKFWEPRMRRQLFEILDKEENGLDALVLQAAPMIRKPEAEANQVR
ncbi:MULTISPECIES: formate dehydrogenase subunit delta [Rhizobium]|uniref:formate dehydrogenase subunit delta n=1 Tax=Rhizobium TaxID=379 RepID=UPI0007EB2978|nr:MULTISPECIES: formate dehydrogenase subunit delta [Rhizobium]ANK93444.1 FdsD family formate dehydrogenase delta subunit protein [Rhizobium sp. N6212]ANK99490.1 FdsD family formate dehydrogenase delta subunit protein [Rhizobium sp. N621]ANL05621.1 FdsD family formate dehydrogenase delta subunit protein [Rhizobium esperanzae]ANL11674.1 FdsD family formate dehydrogenase delta subunit protein [Rhizobium sp. N1341]ANL23748.1 FdsD family formate dehydrogenase delta subunit protein [Rhizobium sp. 